MKITMNTDSPFYREQIQLAALEQRKASSLTQNGHPPLVHALDKIIQKCLLEEGRKKKQVNGREVENDIQISIDYLDMPRSEIGEVRRFFTQLQEAGCFEKQECVGNWVFSVTKPDTSKLQAYRQKLLRNLGINQDDAKPQTGQQNIKYVKANYSLYIGETKIDLSKAPNQANLCKVVLADKEAASKSWEAEEIFKAWGYTDDRIYDADLKKRRPSLRLKVYHAANDINIKVFTATGGGIPDFLDITTQITTVNPKYRNWIVS